jgi:putative endonuclease
MKPVYKRMLEGMQAKQAEEDPPTEPWWLYILECRDGTYYTGITKDLDRRLGQHNAGKASRYTRSRRPVELRYTERCDGRTAALVRECKVKALNRKAKEKLVNSQK